jgi:hypothetical protein
MENTSVGSFALEEGYKKHQTCHVPFEESDHHEGENVVR